MIYGIMRVSDFVLPFGLEYVLFDYILMTCVNWRSSGLEKIVESNLFADLLVQLSRKTLNAN